MNFLFYSMCVVLIVCAFIDGMIVGNCMKEGKRKHDRN